MAKSKRGGSAPPKSQSEDSVRSKIISIEGGLGSLTSSLQNQNNNSISLIEISNSLLEVAKTYLRPMEDNIRVMAQSMLGMDITDAKGNKVIKSDMSGGGLEAAAETKKRNDKLDNLEEKKLSAEEEQSKLLKEIHKSLQKGGVLDIILGGALALAGFISGFVGEYIKVFKKVLSPLTKIFGEGNVLTKIIEKFKTGWAKFGTYIDDIVKGVLENKYIGKVIGVFKSGWTSFVNYFKGIADVFKGVTEMWGNLFGGGGGGFFKNIMTWFEAIGERLGWFFKLGKGLGKILGKIAIPIQIIMSIFDTVTGALDGWNNTEGDLIDKIFGAIKGGITGLLNGLVGGLLDLLKDGVSWLLSLMGFDELSKSLDSFSFQDLIGNLVSGYFDFIKGMVRFVMDLFTNPGKAMETLSNVGDWLLEGYKKILRATLPNPASDGMAGWTAKLIPDSVYEFAGMNPKTGAVVQKSSEASVATKALEKTTNENTQAKDAAAASAAAASAASNNSSSSKVVNNNTTQAAIIKTKTTNWEPDDQWARGGGMAWGA